MEIEVEHTQVERSSGDVHVKVVRSHSLGEFWKSALRKSMSAKAPGAGEGGMEHNDQYSAKVSIQL